MAHLLRNWQRQTDHPIEKHDRLLSSLHPQYIRSRSGSFEGKNCRRYALSPGGPLGVHSFDRSLQNHQSPYSAAPNVSKKQPILLKTFIRTQLLVTSLHLAIEMPSSDLCLQEVLKAANQPCSPRGILEESR